MGEGEAIRTRSLDGIIEHLVGDTLADDIATALPPVPGRKWAVGKAASVLFTLWAMVAEVAMRDPEAGRQQFICEIEYKGWVRTKVADTGYFTGPVMALLPGLDALFREEAARHRVPVEAAPSTAIANAEARVAWLREKRATMLGGREEVRGELEA